MSNTLTQQPTTNTPSTPSTPSTTYAVSGKVTNSDGSSLAGVAVSLSGTSSNSTLSNAYGDYSFTGLGTGNYTLTPSATGMSFNPATRSISISTQNATNQNFQRYYPSTALIATYMDVRHTQMIAAFVSAEDALRRTLAAQGLLLSGTYYKQSRDSYISQVNSFASDSLIVIGQEAQFGAIDTAAVRSLFAYYAGQDARYAETYYQCVNSCAGLSGTALTDFIKTVTDSTNAIYNSAIAQVP